MNKIVLASTDSAGTSTGDLESPTVTIGDTSLSPVIGQVEWTGLTASDLGTSWTVPTDVTSISIFEYQYDLILILITSFNNLIY